MWIQDFNKSPCKKKKRQGLSDAALMMEKRLYHHKQEEAVNRGVQGPLQTGVRRKGFSSGD